MLAIAVEIAYYVAMKTSSIPSHMTDIDRAPQRFTSIPLRVGWARETQFTRWLAANLDRLGYALDLRLSVWRAKAIGADRIADLLARNEDDGTLAVIENQLELADDAHLGQLLAYLAGSDAKTMIWIAEGFEARHLAVIRWLNEATGDEYRFFAVRVRIALAEHGGVEPAFDVMQSPVDWAPPLGHLGPIVELEFPAGFWAFHLHRHPDEAWRSRVVGPRCRWRSTKVKGVVISQFVYQNAVCVFLRGANGVTVEDAKAALAPFAWAIQERVGDTICNEGLGILVGKRLDADYAIHSETWCAMSDWMRAQADLFDLALGGIGDEKGARKKRRP